MAHANRNQRKLALSVRTRALIQKLHERVYHRQLASKGSDMQLRTRKVAVTMNQSCTQSLDPSTQADGGNEETLSTPAQSTLDGDVSNGASSSSTISSADSSESNPVSVCDWEGCGDLVEPAQLIAHIQHAHILPQLISNRRKCFICLWRGCRVFRRPSVSSAWLESHVVLHTHAKGKPFRCIFDGCQVRFSTSILLERHVRSEHMRSCRARPLTGVSSELKSTIGDDAMTSNRMEQQQTGTDGIQTPPVQNGKKSCRRRKKPKCYRVRRIDFYDRRSQCVIGNRLRIIKVLNTDEQPGLATGSHIRPSLTLPGPIVVGSTKPRLRSSANITSLQNAPKRDSTHTVSSSAFDRRRNLALLLTTPHTFVGQRLTEDQQVEFLIRWTGQFGSCPPAPMWIRKEELQAASVLGIT